jgi:hypothetical protein
VAFTLPVAFKALLFRLFFCHMGADIILIHEGLTIGSLLSLKSPVFCCCRDHLLFNILTAHICIANGVLPKNLSLVISESHRR